MGLFRKKAKGSKKDDEKEKETAPVLAVRAYAASRSHSTTAAAAAGAERKRAAMDHKMKKFRAAAAALTTTAAPSSTTAAASTSTNSPTTKARTVSTTTAEKQPPPQQQQPKQQKGNNGDSSNFLTRTQMFHDLLDWAFDQVDADGSGEVDEQELYSGLLLIHLKLGQYAGPAACKPISRDQTTILFAKFDVDGNGTLSKDEFDAVMVVLFGNALLRVAFQYGCTIVLVPLLAQQVLSVLLWSGSKVVTTLLVMTTTLDEQTGGNLLGVDVEDAWERAWETTKALVLSKTPPRFVDSAMSNLYHNYLCKIPPSVWNSIPLTLLSTILSLMLIPWSLMKIDDFFQSLADRSNKNKKKLGVDHNTQGKKKTTTTTTKKMKKEQ